MDKTYNPYFLHILDSILLIEKYTENISFEIFEQDQKTIDAVIRNLEIIGEASTKFPGEIRDKYPNIPWKTLIGLRNILIHEYFGVDNKVVWINIQQHLPILKNEIQKILDEK